MRTLTITWRKNFFCLAKFKVYIKDPNFPELTISGVPCRKLGVIKNGKTETFQIGDSAAKVFVISDTMSKQICSECYQLNDGFGGEVIALTGKFCPADGSAFRFDNNTSPIAVEIRRKSSANRSKINKKTTIILIIVFVIELTVTFFAEGGFSKTKSFSVYDMTITVGNDFVKSSEEYVDMTLESNRMIIFITCDSFEEFPELVDYRIGDYADDIRDINGNNDSAIKTQDGLTWYESEYVDDGKVYCYYTYFFRSGKGMWIVDFCVNKEDTAKYRDDITEWAHSVRFD